MSDEEALLDAAVEAWGELQEALGQVDELRLQSDDAILAAIDGGVSPYKLSAELDTSKNTITRRENAARERATTS